MIEITINKWLIHLLKIIIDSKKKEIQSLKFWKNNEQYGIMNKNGEKKEKPKIWQANF